MSKSILVVASTFPFSRSSTASPFVRELILALKRAYPELEFSVLAPHDQESRVATGLPALREDGAYREYRFHYFWPFQFEILTGSSSGIMPTLRRRPLAYLLIPFFMLAEFSALWRLVRRLHPDTIYAHWFTPQAIVSEWVSRLTHTPFVFTSHSSDVAVLHRVPFFGGTIVRFVARRARAISVVSHRVLARLRSFFNDRQWEEIRAKVVVIPMGVDAPGTDSVEPPSPSSGGILFMGRLVEKKGVHYLLPAFASIMHAHPHGKLTIAGEGPWMQRLKDQAARLTLPSDRISFPGYVVGSAKQELMREADIFVVPSIVAADGDVEGLPVTLLEGLAAGKVCVATRESGADDIMEDGKDGFLVREKDTMALAAALERALQMGAAEKRAMRTNAIAKAGRFSWPEIARLHYLALLNAENENPDHKQRLA